MPPLGVCSLRVISAPAAGVFIVAAKRTPFGTYGGLLKDFSATDLTEHAARAALAAGKVPPEIIDSVVVGNVMQVGGLQNLLPGGCFRHPQCGPVGSCLGLAAKGVEVKGSVAVCRLVFLACA